MGFACSDAVDSSTIATGTADATLVLNVPTKRLLALTIFNAANQQVELFFNRNTTVPTGTVVPDMVLPANSEYSQDTFSFGRTITGTVYARYKSAATGSLIINAIT